MQLFKSYYRSEEILIKLKEVLDIGWTATGKNCKEFEDKWNRFIGCEYSHYLNSCTAALHIAVRLLDLSKGSKIISTPITFISTNAAILYEDMVPVFADVDPNYLSLDPNSVLRKAETEKATAVIWVHYGGMVHPDFLQTVEKLNEMNIPVIEDCAHAAGSFYPDGARVGSKNISCFSFQAVKNMPSFDGGAITVQTKEQYDRVKRLSWLGISQNTFDRTAGNSNEIYKWQYDVPELGWKYNGNEPSAIMSLVSLKYLDRDNAYRKQIYEWYKKLKTPLIIQDDSSSHHLCVTVVDNRDQVISALKANDISPGVHYMPNYKFKPFEQYYDSCQNTETISDKIISLPNHLYLEKNDVDKVVNIINETQKN